MSTSRQLHVLKQVCSRRGRLPQPLEATAVASEPTPPPPGNDVPDREPLLSNLLAGLRYEARNGLVNAQGTERFSDFAARRAGEVAQHGGARAFASLAEGFQHYQHMSEQERRQIVQAAITQAEALQAARAGQPQPVQQTDDAAAGGGMREPRMRSSGPGNGLPRMMPVRTAASAHAASEASTPGRGSSVSSSASGTGVHSPMHGGLAGSRAGAQQGTDPATGLTSSRFRGIKLMSAGNAAADTRLLSEADLGAALAEQKGRRGGRGGDRSCSAAQPMVGEEEEFSVGGPGAEPSEGADEDALEAGAARRQLRPQTAAFRASFVQAAAAAAQAELEAAQGEDLGAGEQRTAAWHAERDKRLTASAFGNALGFWPEGRVALWEEKLQLREPFSGNQATDWGTKQEEAALARYVALTGHGVSACRFSVLRDDPVHGWLGASPDGLIDALTAMPGEGVRLAAGEGPGVLEIKCPYNRGRPQEGRPPAQPPWYYMPQVQGLMEVFGREWCNIYLWTPNGSALFHVPRDRAYWGACFEVLSDFWWAHLVPAKHALAAGDRALAEQHRPRPSHPLTGLLTSWSKDMAASAEAAAFPPAQKRSAVRRMAPPAPAVAAGQ